MNHAEAAALLGVPLDASVEEIRRAWRTWARLAHPDAGGQPSHFNRLRIARDLLLTDPMVVPGKPVTHTRGSATGEAPTARLPWSVVLRTPSGREVVAWSALLVVTVLLGALPAVLGVTSDPLALAICASPAAIAAAGCASIIVSRLLTRQADVGHRIMALTFTWLPIVTGQIILAQLAGVSLVPVLPVLALPFVAAIAAVNPGAGLWVRSSR